MNEKTFVLPFSDGGTASVTPAGDCGVTLIPVRSYAISNGAPEGSAAQNHGYITMLCRFNDILDPDR